MVRTPCYDKNGIKKGTWTKEEDEKLKAYVTKYGCWNWRLIPKFAGLSRCGKSCRLRWMNYLRPGIKRGNFQKEEDETILQLHETLGNRKLNGNENSSKPESHPLPNNRWSAIAAHLPGRTDNEIKNRWITNLSKLSNQKPSNNSNLGAATASSSARICSQQNSLQEDSDQTLFVLNSAADEGTSLGEAEDVGFSTQLSMELGGNLWTDPFIFEDTFRSSNYPTDASMDLLEDFENFTPLFDDFLWP